MAKLANQYLDDAGYNDAIRLDPLSDGYQALAQSFTPPAQVPVQAQSYVPPAPGEDRFAYPTSPLFDQQVHQANLDRERSLSGLQSFSNAFSSLAKLGAGSAAPQAQRLAQVSGTDNAWFDKRRTELKNAVPEQYALALQQQKQAVSEQEGKQKFASAEEAAAMQARRSDPNDQLATDFRAMIATSLVGAGMSPDQAKLITKGLSKASFNDMANNPALSGVAKIFEAKAERELAERQKTEQLKSQEKVASIHEAGATRRQRELLARPELADDQYVAVAKDTLKMTDGVAEPTPDQVQQRAMALKANPQSRAFAAKRYDELAGGKDAGKNEGFGLQHKDLQLLQKQEFQTNQKYTGAWAKDKFFEPKLALRTAVEDALRAVDASGVGLVSGRVPPNARAAVSTAMKKLGISTTGMDKELSTQAMLTVLQENIRRSASGASLTKQEEAFYEKLAGASNDESSLRANLSALKAADDARMESIEKETSSDGLLKLALDGRVSHLSPSGMQRVMGEAKDFGLRVKPTADRKIIFVKPDGSEVQTNVRY